MNLPALVNRGGVRVRATQTGYERPLNRRALGLPTDQPPAFADRDRIRLLRSAGG